MKLSLCIPTYNRADHLANCLQSILSNRSLTKMDFEVCVSDNASTDHTENVVLSAQKKLRIKYRKNPYNLGIPRNFLGTVEMAQGEFAWLLGDDDLLLPHALDDLFHVLERNPDVDFFYVNSFHLTTQYVFSFPQPFDTAHLPDHMEPFSSWPHSGRISFLDLIDPRISFDFLGGMYLSVFRRENWISSAHVLDKSALTDDRTFSHFDNTFPHVKIFAKAFAHSEAYFCAKPLTVCLTGAREWAPMYHFIRSVRLVEALEEYRKNGLSLGKFLRCKNYALRTFLPDLAFIYLNKEQVGLEYVRPMRLIPSNFLYPNFYLSVLYFLIRKLKQFYRHYSGGDTTLPLNPPSVLMGIIARSAQVGRNESDPT